MAGQWHGRGCDAKVEIARAAWTPPWVWSHRPFALRTRRESRLLAVGESERLRCGRRHGRGAHGVEDMDSERAAVIGATWRRRGSSSSAETGVGGDTRSACRDRVAS